MAIDTKTKRISATHFLIPMYAPWVYTDGKTSLADRMTLAWLYNGIASTAFVTYSSEASGVVIIVESVSLDEIMIETGGSDEVM